MSGPYLEETCSVSFVGHDRNQDPKLLWLVAISSVSLSAEAGFPYILIENFCWLEWNGFTGSIGNAPKEAVFTSCCVPFRILLVTVLICRGCRKGVSCPSCRGRKVRLCWWQIIAGLPPVKPARSLFLLTEDGLS